MRDRAAQEGDVLQPRHRDIGDIIALAVEKPRILLAAQPRADAGPGGGGVPFHA